MKLETYIGEATAYDKKQMLERKDPVSWLKSVSAFANTQGGKLLFGVRDNGELVGLADASGDAETISEAVKAQMDPAPEIDLSIHEEKGRRFVVVDVKAGAETPYYTFVKGHRDAYVRIGNESVKASAIELKRLVLKGAHRSWDSILTEYRRDEFSFEVLRATYLQKTKVVLKERDFESFGLASGDVVSVRRNPVIADLFQRLDLMERRGSGFKKILAAYAFESEKRNAGIKPGFRSTRSAFFVVLPNLNYGRSVERVAGQVAGQVTGQVAGQVAGRAEGNLNCTANSLTVNVKRLLRVLKTDMGINEIMTKIRLSSRTHLRKSALTPALELGLVEMTQPDSPRSPTQKYRLTAKGRAAINNNEHN